MRKSLFVLILFLFSCVHIIKAENKQLTRVTEINGQQWMKLKRKEKVIWAMGFITANEAARIAIFYAMPFPEEAKRMLLGYLYITEDPIEIAKRVDEYYKITKSLEAPVWAVIYVIYSRNWWPLTPLDDDRELELEPVKPLV